jgi:hypothetical protein
MPHRIEPVMALRSAFIELHPVLTQKAHRIVGGAVEAAKS